MKSQLRATPRRRIGCYGGSTSRLRGWPGVSTHQGVNCDHFEHACGERLRPWKPAGMFPSDFLWGSATSSYQIEGATTVDGRGRASGTRFCARPGTIKDGSSGDVACDHYHRFAEDIALMQRLNLNAYRFSIAWPRVIPEGRGDGQRARARLLRPPRRRTARPRPAAAADPVPLGPAAGPRRRRRVARQGDCRGIRRLRRGGRRSAGRPGRRLDDAERAVRHRQPRVPHGRARARAQLTRRFAGDEPPLARRPRPGDGTHPLRRARCKRRHRLELHAR